MRPSKLMILLVVLLSVSIVFAQDDACPTIVAEALAAADEECSDLERNTACYGNFLIDAVATDTEFASFEAPGDIADLTTIESMTLSPMDTEEEVWGVAVMSVQANLPDTNPGQNVTFLLFGDVEIENAGDAMEAFYFRSGIGDSACAEAPDSGILIRTPEGTGNINLTVNDVEIELGSTAYLTAEAEEEMTIALLDGQAAVEAEDESQVVDAGFYVTVPMDENLSAAGPPSEPQEIESDSEALPTASLPEGDEEGSGEGEDVAAASGDEIVPLSGTWVWSVTNVSSSGAGCFPGVDEQIAAAIDQVTIPNAEFEEGFTLESAFAEGAADLPAGTTFSNPEPNLHIMEITMEGTYLRYEFRIVSETRIEGIYTFDTTAIGVACVTTIEYVMEHSG